MLYFAYGSNLDWDQMRERCPTSMFVCIAELPKHKLAFTYNSSSRGCGVADVIPDEQSSVWGVIYQIDERDIGNLDKCEGFDPNRQRNAYFRKEIHVHQKGNLNKPVLTTIYIVQNKSFDEGLKPNRIYKDLIVNGARFWHLPDDYITNVLQPIEVIQ